MYNHVYCVYLFIVHSCILYPKTICEELFFLNTSTVLLLSFKRAKGEGDEGQGQDD